MIPLTKNSPLPKEKTSIMARIRHSFAQKRWYRRAMRGKFYYNGEWSSSKPKNARICIDYSKRVTLFYRHDGNYSHRQDGIGSW